MKHTKGPWFIQKDKEFNRLCIDADSNLEPICEFSLSDTTKEVEANARLIAAAPEMLAFIQKVLNEQLSHGSHGDQEYIQLAESLVFKATGGEE